MSERVNSLLIEDYKLVVGIPTFGRMANPSEVTLFQKGATSFLKSIRNFSVYSSRRSFSLFTKKTYHA